MIVEPSDGLDSSTPSFPWRSSDYRQRAADSRSRALSPADLIVQPRGDRTAERMGPRKTIDLDASHASLASQASPVVDLIDEAARDLSAS